MADRSVPELVCYPLWPDPPPLTPVKSDRSWMDETTDHYAYRCIPLSIANASGWELALPFAFSAAWHGGVNQGDIQIVSHDPRAHHFVTSHFGHGVLTFHTGW